MLPNIVLAPKKIRDMLKANAIVVAAVGKHPTKNTIQIYRNVSPQGAIYPLIIIALLSGKPKNGQGHKIFDKLTYLVKFIIEGETTVPVHEALGEIERMFQQNQTVDDDINVGSQIVTYVDYTEELESVRYNHIGFSIEFFTYANV